MKRLRDLTWPTGEEKTLEVEYPAPRWQISPRQALLAAALVTVLCALWLVWSSREEPTTEVDFAEVAGLSSAVPTEIVVAVVGEVEHPGLLSLPSGSRVADALAQAVPRPGADLLAVNLARPLADGEQILIAPPGASSPSAGVAEAGKINLNTANQAELETLDGIGPATAAAIIAHREEAGPFNSIDQLDDVSGIGPAKLAALRDAVTL